MTYQEFIRTLEKLFGKKRWPKPLHILQALNLLENAVELSEAAKTVGTSSSFIIKALESPDPVHAVFNLRLDEIDRAHRRRASQILGQLLLGRCAEFAFEGIYRTEMHSEEFELRDLREGRTVTDYRLYNGRGRPMYRINIKFHGSPFRRSRELVGLDADDCFALATYKILNALQKQQEEALPYFFAIVGVPNLTGDLVGNAIPSSLVDTVAFVAQAPKGRFIRDIEDAVVHHLVTTKSPIFKETLQRILGADWYILSAKRANMLLREKLFERVFALRVRGFARAFKGAELDMHFSLSEDLIPLRHFLGTLRDEGPQKITTLLERGDF